MNFDQNELKYNYTEDKQNFKEAEATLRFKELILEEVTKIKLNKSI
jgi:hypothetical protein